MEEKLFVILKKYPVSNVTTVCLRYGKSSRLGGTFNASDCFVSDKLAQDVISHFQSIGSSARYRVVEARLVGTVKY